MKKNGFVFMLVLGLVLGSCLQNLNADVGVKGGVSFATINTSESIPYFSVNQMTGYQIGIFGSFGLTKNIAFQPELYFARKGAEGENLLNNIDGKWNLDYLEIPMLLKFQLFEQGKVIPSIFFGAYLAINISAKEKVPDYPEENRDIQEMINPSDYGLVLGGGVDFTLGKGKLVAEARYSFGLKDINDSIDMGNMGIGYIKIKNRSFILMLGYAFK